MDVAQNILKLFEDYNSDDMKKYLEQFNITSERRESSWVRFVSIIYGILRFYMQLNIK